MSHLRSVGLLNEMKPSYILGECRMVFLCFGVWGLLRNGLAKIFLVLCETN